MAYTVTDTDLLKSCEYHLLENGNANADGTTFLTSIWTPTKLVAWANDRQMRFLKETSLIVSRATVASFASQNRYALPTDCISNLRVAFENTSGTIISLTRSDTWQLDSALNDWETTAGTPVAWQESETPTLEFDVAPAPEDAGELTLLYVALSTLLTGAGVVLSIPDEWAPYITWGILADALASDGEGCDPPRAAYAESRFNEGIELARVTLRGIGVAL